MPKYLCPYEAAAPSRMSVASAPSRIAHVASRSALSASVFRTVICLPDGCVVTAQFLVTSRALCRKLVWLVNAVGKNCCP